MMLYVVVIVSEDLPNSQSILAQVLTHTSRLAGWQVVVATGCENHGEYSSGCTGLSSAMFGQFDCLFVWGFYVEWCFEG